MPDDETLNFNDREQRLQNMEALIREGVSPDEESEPEPAKPDISDIVQDDSFSGPPVPDGEPEETEEPEEQPSEEEVSEEAPPPPDEWSSIRERYTPEQIQELEQRSGAVDTFNRIVETQGSAAAVDFFEKYLGKPGGEVQQAEPEEDWSDYTETEQRLARQNQAIQKQLDELMGVVQQSQVREAETLVDTSIERALSSDEWKPFKESSWVMDNVRRAIRDSLALPTANVNRDNYEAKIREFAAREYQNVSGLERAFGSTNEVPDLKRLGEKKRKAKAGVPPSGGPKGTVRARPSSAVKEFANGASKEGRHQRIQGAMRIIQDSMRQE